MNKYINKYILRIAGLGVLLLLSGCAEQEQADIETTAGKDSKKEIISEMESENTVDAEKTAGLAYETAADGHIDFAVLQEENPDIFAWLYIPGTNIDMPVLQSPVSDEYYKTHTADGAEGEAGALYTEMPNMMNMCDFNTVIHGKDDGEEALFADLHLFENPDFFAKQNSFYLYLPDNVLTYEVFAAYYDNASDILRRYDYTTYAGCQGHLNDIYGLRDMTKMLREGWEDLTAYHFLVTLDGSVKDGRQYVVIGVLTGDAAGHIDRVILD